MKKRTDILLLFPSLAGFTTFFLVPLLYIFYYAFTENAFSHTFVGLQNFYDLFTNGYFRLAMTNTGLFALIAVPLTMVLSLCIALAIATFGTRLPFVRSAFFLPVLLPSATIVLLWNDYFAEVPPFPSLLIIYLWKYGGLNVMLLLTALAGVEKDMLEAAKIDGCGGLRRVWHVLLPNITPTLFFTLTLSIVNALKIFRESYLLYGAYPDDSVYMLQNYMNNHFAKLNYQNISTAAILFGIVVYTVVAVLFACERKWSERIW